MGRSRAVVIGFGDFGEQHLQRYRAVADVDVVGIADADPDRRRYAEQRYHVAAHADGVELIETTRPDLVSIATGPRHHLRLVASSLRSGARVLVEKPFAATPDDARAMASLPSAGERVAPAHILRFDSAHRWVKKLIMESRIGAVTAIDSERHRERGHQARYPDHSLAELTLYHDLDLALWLSGEPAGSICARQTGPETRYMSATVRTPDRMLWTLRASWARPEGSENHDRLQVFGTDGVIELTVAGGLTTVTVESGSEVESRTFTDDSLAEEIAAFVDGECHGIVTVTDGVDCVRLIDAVGRSVAGDGTMIKIEEL